MTHKSMTELSSIVQEVQPIPQGFTFRGKDYTVSPALQTDAERIPAIYNLMIPVMYTECYAKKLHFQQNPNDTAGLNALAAGVGDATEYLQNLIAHNHSKGIADSGWTVTSVPDNNYIHIAKGGNTRTIRAAEYLPQVAGAKPQVNEVISFKTKNGEPTPGFYYVYGNEVFDYTATIIRFYWNVSARGAAEVVAGVSRTLNDRRIPFLFKCLIDPTHFTRRDCCVLYLQQRYFDQVLKLLPLINETATPYMHNDVSLFSHQLMPGLGIAESPIDGNSFGMNRMQMVSTGLLNAFYLNKTSVADRIGMITDIFNANNVDINVPFLNERSHTRTLDICNKNTAING